MAQGAGTATAAAPAAAADVYVPNLTGIVIVGKSEDVKQSGITDVQGVSIRGPQFLQRPDFENLLSRHLNAPLTEATAKQIQVEIIRYCRTIDHSVVDVLYREQEIVNGTIQIAVVEGLVGKIKVTNDGPKYFSDTLILGDLHLKSGEPIIQSKLDSDISWLNQNGYESLGTFEGTFRDVQTELTPGDNVGEVDVNLVVTDRPTIRPFAGYDNDGIPVIGKDRAFAGFDWANAFGVDQRLTYQYTTDTGFDRYRAHLASYTIPLPGQQTIELLGAYSEVTPDFALFGPTYSNLHINNGSLYQLSLRYTVNLPQEGTYRQNLSAGFDYKHIDTPLFFGSSSAGLLSANEIDVDQFTVGYQGYLPDSNGSTAISVQLVESPGGLTSNNNNADFDGFMDNTNAHANYQYAQIEIRRETLLPEGFTWMLRGLTQFTGNTLIASETFGLGGYATVPGYDERTVTGDKGWLVQNELRTPKFGAGNLTQMKNGRDWIQAVIFADWGGVTQEHVTQGQSGSDQLLSVGVGLRYQVSDKFHVRLDYGDQVKRGYLNDPGELDKQASSQVAVGVEISY
jgi:hemolysin activation/secretion protein